jgi:hypothetical protein
MATVHWPAALTAAGYSDAGCTERDADSNAERHTQRDGDAYAHAHRDSDGHRHADGHEHAGAGGTNARDDAAAYTTAKH